MPFNLKSAYCSLFPTSYSSTHYSRPNFQFAIPQIQIIYPIVFEESFVDMDVKPKPEALMKGQALVASYLYPTTVPTNLIFD